MVSRSMVAAEPQVVKADEGGESALALAHAHAARTNDDTLEKILLDAGAE